ncbi:Chromodomain-helicase-DNA-binding protein 1 [Nymphon striatum]|nr:Chromodomain-helicase-DNA-binding protein 1 [Nymphon striatum]
MYSEAFELFSTLNRFNEATVVGNELHVYAYSGLEPLRIDISDLKCPKFIDDFQIKPAAALRKFLDACTDEEKSEETVPEDKKIKTYVSQIKSQHAKTNLSKQSSMNNLKQMESSSGEASSSDSDSDSGSSSSSNHGSFDKEATSNTTPSLLTETVSVIKEQAQDDECIIHVAEDNKSSYTNNDESVSDGEQPSESDNESVASINQQRIDSSAEDLNADVDQHSDNSEESNADVGQHSDNSEDSNADVGQHSDNSEDSNADVGQHSHNSEDSNSSSGSSSGNVTKKKKKKSVDIKQLVEENPEMYGVRRSGRSRKEPERLTFKEDSDERSSKRGRKLSRNSGTEYWNQDSSEEEEEESDNYFSKPRRAVKPVRRIAGSRRKPASKSFTSKQRNLSSDESDDEYSDAENRRESARRSAAKVSYKEQSADETDSDDVIPGDSTVVVDDNSEVIERVICERQGRKGATGSDTTIYASNSDPNNDFNPENEEAETQYLIKWKNWSYIHDTWETEETLKEQAVKGMKKLQNYINQQKRLHLRTGDRKSEISYLMVREKVCDRLKDGASPEELEYHECQMVETSDLIEQYTQIERIVAHEKPKPGLGSASTYDYYCKWTGLPYSDCTWEDGTLVKNRDRTKIDEYFRRLKSQRIPSKVCKALKVRPKFLEIKEQPKFLGGAGKFVLRDYQLDGINWLVHSWCKENSVILADEMGLGKTIQTIGFVSYLHNHYQVYGPFLIVVPLSTMAAWITEFYQWAPELNVVVYLGDIHSRNIIREYEWCHSGNKRLKYNVILTTYEILLKDKGFLGREDWAMLAVDEAHRLKNDDSLLYKSLTTFSTKHRLLITGTPLQNTLKELWSLIHFIMPDLFDDWEDFEKENLDCDVKGYSKLHKMLEPFLLRRVKKDVEKSLPAKVEQILRVEMSSVQKQYYKWILTKNYRSLTKGLKGNYSGFINIVMELKKCCNHTTLIRPPEVENPNRLDRLDGSMKGDKRKQSLDHFNAENSSDFCFLLSTRAGGLGINLATADTVVIFDSDWNPQNDLQAQARAHRIGQKNQVNIYRLVTRGSVEENIIEKAKQKMVLDHLIIQRMDTTGKTVLSKGSNSSNNSTPFNKDELQSILKFGAQELFKDSENDEKEPVVDIDEILSRAETTEEQQKTVGFELLSQFKVASFNNPDQKEDEKSDTDEGDDAKSWIDIIPENVRQKVEEEEKREMELEMYLPPRSRKSVHVDAADDDSDWERSKSRRKKKDADSSSGDDSDGRPKKRGRPRTVNKDSVKGFSDADIRRFIKSYKKFPNPMKRLESIASDADLMEKLPVDLKKLSEMLRTNCVEAMAEYEKNKNDENQVPNNQNSNVKKRDRGPSFKLSGVNVNAKSVLSCEHELEPLDICLPVDSKERQMWTLKVKCKDIHWDIPWEVEDDSRLLRGIYEYGIGNWESIKMDPAFELGGKILPDDDSKPQGKHLQTRVEYLLKLLRKQVDAQEPSENVKKSRKRKAISKATIENDDSDNDTNIPNKRKKQSNKSERHPSLSSTDIDSTIQSVIDNTTIPSDSQFKPELTHAKKVGEKDIKKEKKSKDKSNSKKISKKEERNNVPMHFTANSLPVAVTQSPKKKDKREKDYEEMFTTCKKLMRPIKHVLSNLDIPKEENMEATDSVKANYLITGNFIDKILENYQDKDERKEMKANLWVFVTNFTEEKEPNNLYKLYKLSQKINKAKLKHSKKGSSSSSKKDYNHDKDKSRKEKESQEKNRSEGYSSHKERSRHSEDGSHHHYRDRDRDRDRDRSRFSDDKRREKSDHKSGYRDRKYDYKSRQYNDRPNSDYKPERDRYNQPYPRNRDSMYNKNRNNSDRRERLSDKPPYNNSSSWSHSYATSSASSSHHSLQPFPSASSSYNSSSYHQPPMSGMSMPPHITAPSPVSLPNYSNSQVSPNSYPPGVPYSSSSNSSETLRRDFKKSSPGSHGSDHQNDDLFSQQTI